MIQARYGPGARQGFGQMGNGTPEIVLEGQPDDEDISEIYLNAVNSSERTPVAATLPESVSGSGITLISAGHFTTTIGVAAPQD